MFEVKHNFIAPKAIVKDLTHPLHNLEVYVEGVYFDAQGTEFYIVTTEDVQDALYHIPASACRIIEKPDKEDSFLLWSLNAGIWLMIALCLVGVWIGAV